MATRSAETKNALPGARFFMPFYCQRMLAAAQAARSAAARAGARYCMNQPWLTTNDWPVSAALGNAERN
ncbi:hypothetical protein, partial [Burkholderia sp. Bp9010]|uniref:hypothetical protein n=1 Tax=Burkholderia sp. Bp9010 TaxID=2184560 RepID=UPI001C8989C3